MLDQAPGQIAYYFAAAVVLTFPASSILLWSFRRQVARAMRLRGRGSELAPRRAAEARRASNAPIRAGSATLRQCAILGLAALLAGIAFTLFFFWGNRDARSTAFLFVCLPYVYAWPLVPSLQLVLHGRYAGWSITAAYVALGAAAVLVWSLCARFVLQRADVTPLANVTTFLGLVSLYAGPPYLTIVAIGRPGIRPVSAFVLVGLLVFSCGGLLSMGLFGAIADRQTLLPTAAFMGPTGLFMVVSLPLGYLCWQVQRQCARWFVRKRFSDAQLTTDAYWVIATFYFVALLAIPVGWSALWSLLVFVVYRSAVELASRLVPLSGHRPRSLLLLRVFGYQQRSQRLFDVVAQQWRFLGHVNMIAAQDLAGRTVDPGDIVSYLGGDFRSRFVRTPAELDQQVALMDTTRDPDGRFRVNDFFCFDDTWKSAVEVLVGQSDQMLMDVRSLAEGNRGCAYEIELLSRLGRLQDALFLVDDGRTADYLRSLLPAAQPRMLELKGDSNKALERVLAALREPEAKRAAEPAPSG